MPKDRRRKTNKNQSGFSLIEILIVTVITTVVFTVIYSFYSATIKQNVEARYEMIASNLAQEGIEIIRNVRDENVLENEYINKGLSGTCYPKIDSGGDTSCDSSGDNKVYIVDSWYVNSSSGTATPFSRICEISGDDKEKEFVATCMVSWDSFVNAGILRKVEAKAFLTDWQKL